MAQTRLMSIALLAGQVASGFVQLLRQGPFDLDKSWITYSGDSLRFYGTLTPGDQLLGGTDDIFLKTSSDFGATWSDPIAITNGLDIQRPVGITVGNTDYLYLPSISGETLYLGIVSIPEPSTVVFFTLAL